MKRMLSAGLLLSLLLGLLPLGTGAQTDPVEKLLQGMSLQDKIAQMLMVDLRYWDEDPGDDVQRRDFTHMNDQVREILARYRFGSVILFSQNLADTEQIFHLTEDMHKAVLSGGGLPLLICTDQEGGNVYRLNSGTALPGNMALGAAGGTDQAALAGRIIGSELAALGINADLAPVADVNSNPANPVIGIRSFGDDPERVGQLAAALVSGLNQFQVAACAKHFPGHGDTAVDSHYGLPLVERSLEELRAQEWIPFQMLIDQGVDMVMTAHILYPRIEQGTEYSRKTGKQEKLSATMSHKILTELLKEEMGFSGIVVTDAMNMAGIANYWDPVQAVVLAIRAGADMICMPCSLEDTGDLKQLDAILQGVETAVTEGTIPESRIDDAVRRILRVKETRGILNWQEGSLSLDRALDTVGGSANREAERHMAAAAVTVVENKNGTLPLILTEESRVLMLVPYENEKAQMLLGWNRAVQAGLIPAGAQVRVVRFSGEISLQQLKGDLDWAEVLIFNSEVSDAARLSGGGWQSKRVLEAVDHAKRQGKTVIVQSVDKPYDVQSYPDADAVLAVYGCKGSSMDPTQVLTGGSVEGEMAFGPNIVAGIEVIFGVFGAKGTLPVDIPRYEKGAFTEEILYPRGYGLHYDSLIPQPEIPEETQAPTVPAPEETTAAAVPTEVPEMPEETAARSGLWYAAAGLVLLVFLLRPKKRPRRSRR